MNATLRYAYYEPDTGRIRNIVRTRPEWLTRDAETRDPAWHVLIVGEEGIGDPAIFARDYKVVDGEFVPVEE